MAVAAHVPDPCQLLGLGTRLGVLSLAIAFLAVIGVWVDVLITLVCHEFCNGLGEGLDLCQHCIELGILCLCVGCLVLVGRRRTCYLSNVAADFIATVPELFADSYLFRPTVPPPAFCWYV